jgi:hypothetical protein
MANHPFASIRAAIVLRISDIEVGDAVAFGSHARLP